jgi:hypothetical protein
VGPATVTELRIEAAVLSGFGAGESSDMEDHQR